MSPAESAERSSQWLTDLVSELPGLRNATSRDPGFKNWRQNAITILQRIWPADQDHAERFRRIPFSPVDPRAEVRVQRESFSRGCQEAARVLNSFIQEIQAYGVPEIAGDAQQQTEESGFVDGFPTVDLPSGDLSSPPVPYADEFGQPPHQAADPRYTAPGLRGQPPQQPPPPQAKQTPSGTTDARPSRKGLNVAAKLRDLLGLTGFAAKPAPAPPPPPPAPAEPDPSLGIIPVGDEVDAPQPEPQRPSVQQRPTVQRPTVQRPRVQEYPPPPPPPPQAAAPAPPAPAPPAPARGAAPPPPGRAQTPPAPQQPMPPAAGMSVVMSRPTTLKGNIGKVSIESLISPEFRGGAESGGVKPPATDTPAPAAASPPHVEPPAARPPLSIVPPPPSEPASQAPPATPASTAKADASEPPARAKSTSKVVPFPQPPGAPARAVDPSAAEPTVKPAAENESDEQAPNAEEFARAAQDFMRSSPVLGATGKKVQRPQPSTEHGFNDPDAIAVMSVVDELTQLGVPATRQSEARARLLDLGRRLETNELDWNALRKAVWFAMEYPEVARRLMPLLLPWIDRAA